MAGSYPADTANANEGKGLLASNGTTYQYTVDNANTGSFCLSAVNGDKGYHIVNNGLPKEGVCPGHTGPAAGAGDTAPPADGITIGSQTWARANLDVGTMVSGATQQTNNSVIEKYCFNDNPANCATYGALYQWDEAMQYSTSAGAQGICPAGWHIPSDEDWKILEKALGMTQAQADATDWRGTNQGTLLKPGGSSGLDIPLGGHRTTWGTFLYDDSYTYLWTSTESGSSAWRRFLRTDYATVYRNTYGKTNGFSVRCLMD